MERDTEQRVPELATRPPEAETPKLLSELLAAAAHRYGRLPALACGDRRISYAELALTADYLAGGLASLGVGPGQRVGLLLPNCPQFVLGYFAAIRTGAMALPISALLGPEEIAYILNNAEVSTLITVDALSSSLPLLRAAVPSLENVVVSGAAVPEGAIGFEELVGMKQQPPAPPDMQQDDVAVLLYTSGTTGRPKGAMLTHRNIMWDAAACMKAIDVHTEEVFLTVLPLFHSFGATVCMVIPILAGACSVMLPKFAPLDVLRAVTREKVTVLAGVPSMYGVLLSAKTSEEYSWRTVRLAVSGGAPLPLEVLHGLQQMVSHGTVLEGYGPTEAAPVVSVNPLYGVQKPGSVGLPLPGIELRVADDNDRTLPVGEVGELLVRGPNVMAGYWRDPAATAEALCGGWLHTGDLARLDEDGYLYIVDRKKDMIIVSGMNVYPREVEDVIYRLPQVAEAAVVGVPSRLRGEDVIATVALREGAALSAHAIIEHCAANLASFKVPRRVVFFPELPKSGSGKILKREIREIVQ